jgi:uncharacterized protein (TIGR02246 family)
MSDRSTSKDESAISTLVTDWAAAVRRKDIAGVLRDHSVDFLLFDVPPPARLRGLDAYRKTWGDFFEWAGNSASFDVREMNVFAGSDVAFVTATVLCAGTGPDGEHMDLDVRLTIGLRKIAGRWTVVHEHHSVPAP